jgi:MFS family permease
MLGVASAIYHPVGSTMLVTHARRLGRDLGVNGVWGNLGAASAAGVTALIAAALGWRAAFIVPGLVCLAAGAAFLALVPSDGDGQSQKTRSAALVPVTRPIAVLCVFAVAVVAGGMTFNVTTIALPKVIDERLGLELPLVLTGWLATLVFVFGALTQLLMGNLVDRLTLPTIFVGLALLQPVGLALAALTTGVPLLVGLALAMAAKAFSVRYFLGFTVGGLAVPMIALLHEQGGVALVLGAATCFGLVICMASLAFYALTLTQPAEMATAGAGGTGNHDGVEGP